MQQQSVGAATLVEGGRGEVEGGDRWTQRGADSEARGAAEGSLGCNTGGRRRQGWSLRGEREG